MSRCYRLIQLQIREPLGLKKQMIELKIGLDERTTSEQLNKTVAARVIDVGPACELTTTDSAGRVGQTAG